MKRRFPIALLASLSLLVALSSMSEAALATSGPATVIGDCNAHSSLTHTYPATQLRAALNTMPASVKEYTNCYDVIQRALLAQLGGRAASGTASSTSSSSGGSFFSAPVIIVVGVLILAAGAFGVVAMRRRSA